MAMSKYRIVPMLNGYRIYILTNQGNGWCYEPLPQKYSNRQLAERYIQELKNNKEN